MGSKVIVRLEPLGECLEVEKGASLRDVLFPHGVEFPCGGRGRCNGCKVRSPAESLPVSEMDKVLLPEKEIDDGWRLACHMVADHGLVLEVAQWDTKVLGDNTAFTFHPGEGLGVAVDVGTTTLVAQLVDLANGHVLAVRTALNPQARHGGDVMSRVEFAADNDGHARLVRLIRSQVGRLVRELLEAAKVGEERLTRVALVGNTVMHHLFCDISLEPLSHYPFEPVDDGVKRFTVADLGWKHACDPTITFLPCLGGFVGSDLLAGILATNLQQADKLVALVDLGTNGEIILGNRERMLCASTAAGPAFEGARISMGMRAATGAISEVASRNGALDCSVIGGEAPRGICGSGLVDAVAVGLDLEMISHTGRLNHGQSELVLSSPVKLTQTDIRELQLAKGAIAAGIRLLINHWGAEVPDVSAVYIAGAFGNYVNLASALRIGLLPVPEAVIQPAGNTALRGAKMALFDGPEHEESYAEIAARTTHLSLSSDAVFQEIYVEEMSFPEKEAPT